jgi:hypothetical protein
MSATQHGTDGAAVDPSHQLEQLVRKVQPHVSHLVIAPRPERIIGLEDEPLMAICTPWIAGRYRMTTKGLAVASRPLFVFTTTPRLMTHVGMALIDRRPRALLIERLQELLDEHYRAFGAKKSA